MSYANGTQFYNLPQTVGTDKRDWFDTNSPFAAIDAALHAAVVGQASNAEAIATINGKLATDEADIAALQTKTNTHDNQIAALQTTVNTQATQIQDVRQDAEDMITANNEGAAATSTRAYAIGDYFIYNDVLYKATAAIAVGDTIVPNTNCEATNVDTELTQVKSDLDNVEVLINPSDVAITTLLNDFTGPVVRRRIGNIIVVNFNIYNPTNQITSTPIDICSLGVNAKDNCYGVLLSNDGKGATVSISGNTDKLKIRAADTIGINTYITGQIIVFV